METFTPKTLADFYAILTKDDKAVFLRLIGQGATADQIHLLLKASSILEQGLFIHKIGDQIIPVLFPMMLDHAIECARKFPQAEKEELKKMVLSLVGKSEQAIEDLTTARFKDAHYPKPRNTERDAEIVRLRDMEGKSFGQIPRLLIQKDQSWCGKNGRPMTRDAVERAYWRRKGQGTK